MSLPEPTTASNVFLKKIIMNVLDITFHTHEYLDVSFT